VSAEAVQFVGPACLILNSESLTVLHSLVELEGECPGSLCIEHVHVTFSPEFILLKHVNVV
jgi:hypothetical protein